MKDDEKIVRFDTLEEARTFFAGEGNDGRDVADVMPKGDFVAQYCQKESEMCSPGGGTYDNGVRTRVVCIDQEGNRYEGEWGPCRSIIAPGQ
ncbi:MAG: hypothetical protein V4857_08540 [Pseudomonadota bacterium]